MRHRGMWRRGDEVETGQWEYYKPSDCFFIWLDSTDPVTGQKRFIETHRDEPEWGKWQLQRDKALEVTA